VLELAEELKKKDAMVLACANEVLRVDYNLNLDDALVWETAKAEPHPELAIHF